MTDFDAAARTWDSDGGKRERARRVAEAIVARVPGLEKMVVLEYGCGTGLLGFELQPRVSHVTMADASLEMLAVVREKLAASGARNATALRLDLTTDPPPGARYDLVCTLMTLHHIEDVDALLRRFAQLLTAGGVVCICDLDSDGGAFHGPGFTGHNGFDREDLRARLARAGFEAIRIETACEVVKDTAAGRRTFPLFLAVARRGS